MKKISKKLLNKIVKLIWYDACGYSDMTWTQLTEAKSNLTLSRIEQVGYLLHIEKDRLILCIGKSSGGTCIGANAIPLAGIVSIKQIA